MQPEELLADLDRELRTVLGALQNFAPVTEDVTVSDETGTVRVTVRPDTSLAAIQVAPVWRDKLEPEALAGVVGDVLGRAQARAMGFDVDRLTEGEAPELVVDEAQVEADRAQMLREAEEKLLRPSTEEELQQKIDALPGTVDAALARFDEEIAKFQEMSDSDLPQDPEEFTPGEGYGELVESENRMVGVRVVAGLIADVTFKESWLQGRSGNTLTECFTQIIDQLPAVVAAQTGQGAHP